MAPVKASTSGRVDSGPKGQSRAWSVAGPGPRPLNGDLRKGPEQLRDRLPAPPALCGHSVDRAGGDLRARSPPSTLGPFTVRAARRLVLGRSQVWSAPPRSWFRQYLLPSQAPTNRALRLRAPGGGRKPSERRPCASAACWDMKSSARPGPAAIWALGRTSPRRLCAGRGGCAWEL